MVTEELLQEIACGKGQPLKELCALLPCARRLKDKSGKLTTRRPTFSRILRWVLDGKKIGPDSVVKLEACKSPAGWVSTAGAVARFFARLTPVGANTSTANRASPRCAPKSAERAARKLQEMGI
jgi:hypothetical protein